MLMHQKLHSQSWPIKILYHVGDKEALLGWVSLTNIHTHAHTVGVGNISLLSYIVILRAHDNRIVVVLKLSSYRVHIISGVVFAEIRHAVAK